MEIIIGLVIVVGVLAYLMLRKQPEVSTPAPVIVPGGEPISTVVVEGAGQVDIPKTNTMEQRLWEQSMANLEKEKAAEVAKVETVATAKKPRKPRAPKVGETAAKSAKAADKKVVAKKATKKATKKA